VKVAVLAGGRSSEHDVSLASAEAVRAGLQEGGHEAMDVRISREGRWSHAGQPLTIEPGCGLLGCDAAFPALHGPYGEDGVVQGLLEALDVPYVGAGVLGSALCMHKVLFKDLMAAVGIPQVDYVALREGEVRSGVERLGLPVFVKPARLGSSVGISKVSEESELSGALDAAFEHDPLVIVEGMSHGMEVECAVLGDAQGLEVSVPGEIVIEAEWYDYEAKYEPGGMELVVPARVPEEVRARVAQLAEEAFRRSGCSGMARCDFFVEQPDGDARVLLNELNTIPGFTGTSVYAKLFEASGLPYPAVLDRLLAVAVDRHRREARYRS
jgi:D-alanine-D-alanine ligase